MLPNIGRLAVEFMLGGKDKPAGAQMGKVIILVGNRTKVPTGAALHLCLYCPMQARCTGAWCAVWWLR